MTGTNSSNGQAKQWLATAGVAIVVWVCAWYAFEKPSGGLPDFSRYEHPTELKRAFFAYMDPIVEQQNDLVREQRETVLAIEERFEAGGGIGFYHRWRLDRLAEIYQVPTDLSTETKIETLKQRVDIVPVELALVQAAKESAWGRSRFALEANNLFGHWCFEPGCGLVPRNRAPGKKHQLKTYESAGEAIANYMRNLNTHPRYLKFRQLRQQLRDAEERLSGLDLADGLLYYSERRQDYVREVKAMIRQFRILDADTTDSTRT